MLCEEKSYGPQDINSFRTWEKFVYRPGIVLPFSHNDRAKPNHLFLMQNNYCLTDYTYSSHYQTNVIMNTQQILRYIETTVQRD